MKFKVDNENSREIYRYYNYFGALDRREIKDIIPKIADFGLAIRLDKLSTRNGILGERLTPREEEDSSRTNISPIPQT
ncbi:hypothetical protein N7539_008514 [Penicillium diatomitis]|uniref:Protein kinase domain-containing protein n=1 Tax=Penicillium diatomitis TaxID=2819901 RepID=A0A9W9WQR0_9EURO|nr:uncharacterized protein N7539_008514 [Penicillium diatomitis]KAJ5471945.1 hypothetical protein N7539_008514 [Penicillium diatomitis]